MIAGRARGFTAGPARFDTGPSVVLVDDIIEAVLDAAARDDRPALVQLLHPYLHWTSGGRTIRGRNKVFELLQEGPPAPADSYELRDGQIYRWIER